MKSKIIVLVLLAITSFSIFATETANTEDIQQTIAGIEETFNKKMDISKLLPESINKSTVSVERLKDFQNAIATYDFIDGYVYLVYCTPGHLTDIRLENSEELTSSPLIGNPAGWTITRATSIEDGITIPHLFFQPHQSMNSTTVTLTTNKRTYYLKLISLDNLYMVGVKFNYPNDNSSIVIGDNTTLKTERPIEALDLNYKIEGSMKNAPKWRPNSVYSDGVRTYIQFSPYIINSIDSPSLYYQKNLNDDFDMSIINYRVKGSVYIADIVIEKGNALLLVSGADRIRITKR